MNLRENCAPLSAATEEILNPEIDYAKLTRAIETLRLLFSSLSGLAIMDELPVDYRDTVLATGSTILRFANFFPKPFIDPKKTQRNELFPP